MNGTSELAYIVAPSIHWMEEWGTWLAREDFKRGGGRLAEKSVAAYLQSIQHFVRWYEQVRPASAVLEIRFHPGALDQDVVAGYFNWLSARKTAPNTYNHRLTTLRKMVRWAIRAGLLTDDPTLCVGRAEEVRLPRKAKDLHELERISATVEVGAQLRRQTESWIWLGERDRLIWAMFKHTTLRIEEICKLDRDDVDPIARELRVVGKGGIHAQVLVNDALMEALERWMKCSPAGSTALIPSRDGVRLTTGQIRRRLKAIGEAAGVRVRPHDMRHTRVERVVRNALESGMAFEHALDVGQTLARHKDRRTTLGYLRASYSELAQINNAV